MTMNLWSVIEPFVETGLEGPKVELKRSVDLSDRPGRASFAKDVMAIANTIGGTGYLIIGVVDRKQRSGVLTEDIPGFHPPDPDAFQRLIAQALHYYVTPPPAFEYHTVQHPTLDRPIGIVVIPRSFQRPHRAAASGEGLREGKAYVRHGAETFEAGPEEEQRMSEGTRRGMKIVVNFARPLTAEQIREVEQLCGAKIDEVIEIPDAKLDNFQPYGPQVEAMIRATGLTAEQWQSLPLLVNVHPFAPATAVLLARLHGIKGRFPDIIRLRPTKEDPQQFEVAEVVELQRLRDAIWGGG